MKSILLALALVTLLAAGCTKVELKQEVPSSPAASYEQLPK
jgi:hypothetical protein